MTTHMTMGITETTTTLPKGFCRCAAAAPATAFGCLQYYGVLPIAAKAP